MRSFTPVIISLNMALKNKYIFIQLFTIRLGNMFNRMGAIRHFAGIAS
jgi:hypothetical protein